MQIKSDSPFSVGVRCSSKMLHIGCVFTKSTKSSWNLVETVKPSAYMYSMLRYFGHKALVEH